MHLKGGLLDRSCMWFLGESAQMQIEMCDKQMLILYEVAGNFSKLATHNENWMLGWCFVFMETAFWNQEPSL